MTRLQAELNSANRWLDLETRWRDKAAASHREQLVTSTQLQCKLVYSNYSNLAAYDRKLCMTLLSQINRTVLTRHVTKAQRDY